MQKVFASCCAFATAHALTLRFDPEPEYDFHDRDIDATEGLTFDDNTTEGSGAQTGADVGDIDATEGLTFHNTTEGSIGPFGPFNPEEF